MKRARSQRSVETNLALGQRNSQIDPAIRIPYVIFLVLVFALAIVHHETLYSMVRIWARSNAFAHGFLIFPISLFLIWLRRHPLWRAGVDPALWLFVPLLALTALWILADLTKIQVVKQLTVVNL